MFLSTTALRYMKPHSLLVCPKILNNTQIGDKGTVGHHKHLSTFHEYWLRFCCTWLKYDVKAYSKCLSHIFQQKG